MKNGTNSALKMLVLIILLSVSANALSMDDCYEGRTVYIDEVFDIEVTVVTRDYSDNTVKVRLNNGDTRWVKISGLMGRFGKEVEDYVEEKARDFIMDCFFGDGCKKN